MSEPEVGVASSGQTWVGSLDCTARDEDFSKERTTERQRGTFEVSLKLKHLRNRALRKWNKDLDCVEVDATVDLDLFKMDASDTPRADCDLRKVHQMARDDILEVWKAAVDLEMEVGRLHEDLEQFRVLQDAFEEEKAAQQAEIRELQEKLEQVQAFWKGKLRGAEYELDDAQRRLLHAPHSSEEPVGPYRNDTSRHTDLEDRNAEMYNELVKANDEVARLQLDKASMKSDISSLKARVRQQTGSAEDVAVVTKKYEAMKTRANNLQARLAQAEVDMRALNDSLTEAENTNQEYEMLIDEKRQQQEELSRHLEALRKVNATLVPDNAANMTQTYDLFAELQSAQANTTVGGSSLALDSRSKRSDTLLPTVPCSADGTAEEGTVKSKGASVDSSVLRKTVAASSSGSGIHIHLHQHFHTHAHQHHHQHDHVHQLGGYGSAAGPGKVDVRKEVSKMFDMIRRGELVPLDVPQSVKTQPAPPPSADGESAFVDHCKAYSGIEDHYIRSANPPGDSGAPSGSGGVQGSGVQGNERKRMKGGLFEGGRVAPKTSTFAYSTTKLKGRTSHHTGPENSNLATVFVENMQTFVEEKGLS